MEEGKGPSLPKVIATKADIDALRTTGAEEHLKYVMDVV
jgi:uroporphyrinogen-III decarboxylase